MRNALVISPTSLTMEVLNKQKIVSWVIAYSRGKKALLFIQIH